MKIVKENPKAIEVAVRVLRDGGLVIYPTETLYGAGVDATNPAAVNKLIAYKNRPFGKPFSVAVTDQKMAEKYVLLNSTAKNLYHQFLPGPLTIISQGRHQLAPGVESETGTLGIRVPAYPLVNQIVKMLKKPITATSANAAYRKRPYSLDDIWEDLSAKQKSLVDLAIDAGRLPKRDPSTVIDTLLDDPVVLRQGEIKFNRKNQIVSRNEEATQNLGKELWQKYEKYQDKRALVFALEGKMGTGKTAFTKGLGRAMGIRELVTSPTFALENEYRNGNKVLYHFDAWRLENPEEMKSLDFTELIRKKSVIAVEWAERVADFIREFDDEAIIIWLKIDYGQKEKERIITWGTL